MGLPDNEIDIFEDELKIYEEKILKHHMNINIKINMK